MPLGGRHKTSIRADRTITPSCVMGGYYLFFVGMFFQKIGQNGRPGGGEPPGALVFTKLLEWYRFEVGDKNILCGCSDLQKSRHLQKSRVTERHNRGTKRKLKSHQAQKKGASRLCGSVTRFFLQMTRLLHVTKITKKTHLFIKIHINPSKSYYNLILLRYYA